MDDTCEINWLVRKFGLCKIILVVDLVFDISSQFYGVKSSNQKNGVFRQLDDSFILNAKASENC